MNRDETIKAIEVMQALVDGKTIECRNGWGYLGYGKWFAINPDDPDWRMEWDFIQNEYRIKPEPRIIYALVDAQGNLGSGLYNEANATSAVRAGNQWVSMAKFIEVIE